MPSGRCKSRKLGQCFVFLEGLYLSASFSKFFPALDTGKAVLLSDSRQIQWQEVCQFCHKVLRPTVDILQRRLHICFQPPNKVKLASVFSNATVSYGKPSAVSVSTRMEGLHFRHFSQGAPLSRKYQVRTRPWALECASACLGTCSGG